MAGSWGQLTGLLFENLVVAEAVKLIRTLGLDSEPYFYRTRSGMEVDLALTTPSGVLCLEIKSRSSGVATDLRAMRSIAEALGSRFKGGIVVTRGGKLRCMDDAGSFWSVPAHRLFT